MRDDMYKLYKAVDSIAEDSFGVYEMCSIIKELGYNDERVYAEFGLNNVFEVGGIICEQINKDKVQLLPSATLDFKELLKDILRGFLVAFPLIVSIIAIFAIYMNLWLHIDNTQNSVERTTLLSLVTALAVILSGGLSQLYVSKGYQYIERKQYNRLWAEFRNTVLLSGIVSLVVGTIIGLIFLFVGFYRTINIEMFIIYFLLLSISWVTIPMFSILKHQYMLVINLCISAGSVFLFSKFLDINILILQILSITVFFSLNLVFSYTILHTIKDVGRSTYYEPRRPINLYSTLPYFLYGLLYYLFIFGDKMVIRWFNNPTIQAVVGIKGDYEIGISWGIVTALVPIILIEGTVSAYINKLITLKKQYNIKDRENFINQNLKDFCILNICLIIFNTVFSCITMSVVMNILLKYHIIWGPYLSSETYMIFTFASCGYMLIATGLFNNLILMYFVQHRYLTKVLAISFGINTLGSFVLSGLLGYHFAVFGFFASCIVFYFLSYFYCIKVFENIDYHLYECNR